MGVIRNWESRRGRSSTDHPHPMDRRWIIPFSRVPPSVKDLIGSDTTEVTEGPNVGLQRSRLPRNRISKSDSGAEPHSDGARQGVLGSLCPNPQNLAVKCTRKVRPGAGMRLT